MNTSLTGILLWSHFRDGAASTVIIVYEKSSSPSLALPCELYKQSQIEALQNFSSSENIALLLTCNTITWRVLKYKLCIKQTR